MGKRCLEKFKVIEIWKVENRMGSRKEERNGQEVKGRASENRGKR